MNRYSSTHENNHLKRAFGSDLKIVEATKALTFTILPKVQKKAVEHDGLCCAIAHALGDTDVAVLRTFTFIKEKRQRKDVVVKYQNGASAQAFIQLFDLGVRLTRPLEVTLLPVPLTHTAKHLAKRTRERAKARAEGTFVRAYRKPALHVASVVVASGKKRTVVRAKASNRCSIRYANAK